MPGQQPPHVLERRAIRRCVAIREVLLDRPNYVQTVDYVRPLGEDFYHATQRAMDRLSERIIEEMQTTDW